MPMIGSAWCGAVHTLLEFRASLSRQLLVVSREPSAFDLAAKDERQKFPSHLKRTSRFRGGSM